MRAVTLKLIILFTVQLGLGALSFPTRALAGTPMICERVFSDNVKAVQQAAWDISKFSDPKFHVRKNFRYAIHMINSSSAGNRSAEATADFVTGADGQCRQLSYSIIDQDFFQAYSTYGFIIEVPTSNIVAANHADMGSVDPNSILIAIEKNGGIPTPESVLADSKKENDVWHEVVAQTVGPKGERAKIVGVVSLLPDYIPSPLYTELVAFAKARNIPVITILP